MENYVFTKNLYLGFLKKNAKIGDVVQYCKTYGIFQNQKVTDYRDFDIAKKHKFLVPSNTVLKEELISKKQKEQQPKEEFAKKSFGFEVKKEQVEINSIPLSKYTKATELNEDNVFVEEDGIIKDDSNTDVHVVTADKDVDKNVDEQPQVKIEQPIEKKEEQKKIVKKAKKTSKKPEQTTVRGMKVVKEN